MRCTGTVLDIQQIFNIKAPLEDLKNMSSLATGRGRQRGSEVGEDGDELVQGTAERRAVQMLRSRSKRSLNACVLKA